jgi:hypothetical protein
MLTKRLFVLCVIFVIAAGLAFSQNRTQEMTVEQSFLQESVELMIIREQSRAESREMKLVALEYIGNAIGRGNTSDEIRAALEFMGQEGVRNQTREDGRITNNFPDVRTRSATYLGRIGTPAAKDALVRMVLDDNEPMVLTEAIRSLGVIGINENNETVNTISWVLSRFDNTNPDNLLALSAIDAYERLASSGNPLPPSAIQMLIRIAEGNYIRPVQDRARELLADLRGF